MLRVYRYFQKKQEISYGNIYVSLVREMVYFDEKNMNILESE